MSDSLEKPLVVPRVLVAGVAVGALAAWTLPGHRLGAGVLLVALAVAAAIRVELPHTRSVGAVAFATLSLALAGTAAIRDATWLVTLNLTLSLSLASLSVSEGNTWEEVLEGLTRVLRRFPLGARVVTTSTRTVLGSNRLRALSPIARGGALGLLLLVPFALLFVTADRAFAQIAANVVVPDWNVTILPARMTAFVITLVLVAAFALSMPRPQQSFARASELTQPDRSNERARRNGIVEWSIAIGILDFLFAAFVLVQIAVLFGGRNRVLETAGLTYAEYARSGFAQLLIAATLTLTVVAIASRWARGRTKQEFALRLLLGLLCCLTIVILISAIRRLGLYEETFGFTRLRLVVHVFMLWLGGIFVLLVSAGALAQSAWLPRTTVVWTALVAILFSAINPDGFIAERNVDRFLESGELDVNYVSTLSADAVPALAELPPEIRSCALASIAARLSDGDSLPALNLGRERARDVLASLDVSGAGSCGL